VIYCVSIITRAALDQRANQMASLCHVIVPMVNKDNSAKKVCT